MRRSTRSLPSGKPFIEKACLIAQNLSVESINQKLCAFRDDLKMCARIKADIPIMEEKRRNPYHKQKIQERPRTCPRTHAYRCQGCWDSPDTPYFEGERLPGPDRSRQ